MPVHSVNELVEKLARHPDEFSALNRRLGHVPLLPLLELPQQVVVQTLAQSFRDYGLSDADFASISLRDLVVAALESGSNYWAGRAVKWLDEGFPIDDAIARAGDELVEAKRGTQADRHMLFRLIRRYERSPNP